MISSITHIAARYAANSEQEKDAAGSYALGSPVPGAGAGLTVPLSAFSRS